MDLSNIQLRIILSFDKKSMEVAEEKKSLLALQESDQFGGEV